MSQSKIDYGFWVHERGSVGQRLCMILRSILFLAMAGCLNAEPIKQLGFLKWMEGTWVHESEGSSVRMTSRWIEGGKFLERSFDINMGTEPLKKLRQTVFWDPAKKQVRSWGVYSDGGFEEAVWKMKGATLFVSREITRADGVRGKAVSHWTLIDKKNCAWSSNKRSMGKEKFPDIPGTSLRKD